uniref:Putative wuschel homeobox protein WOX8/9 n=1 Tax=Picea abies TaxID=3329 RepID=D5LMH9_PICAB|nr:putative wuschel homeobox protein WOX8/9 [Picea abies]
MNLKEHWPSMFKVKPSTSNNQWHETSNSSAISGERPSYEGSTSENEERSPPEPKPRWNPKPEQLRILESVFNSGMVNPPRDEIKRIRAQLQEFGQVGDANVFYWFQNRKSRTKQRQRHFLSEESSKCSAEKTRTDQSKAIMDIANTTAISLHNTGESYSSAVPAAPFSAHQEHYRVQMNGEMSNDQCSYMQAVAAAAARGGIYNEGTGEDLIYGRSITVLINDIAVEVPVGPINVRAVFGENAVLLHSTGQPVLLNEWGFTLESLQHGAMYYVI